jgi:hypothetical protein
MKPSEKTNVPEKPKYIEIKHYILVMRSRKEKWFSNISPQMSR